MQFKIREDAFKKIRTRWLTFMLGAMAIAIVVSFATNLRDLATGLISLAIMFIFLGYSLFRGLKRQKQFLSGYSVTIADNEIIRVQPNTPTITISFMEIKQIIKAKKGGFIIKGEDRTDIIYISRYIANPTELEKQLLTLAPVVENVKPSVFNQVMLVLSILAFLSFMGVVTLTDKVLVLICGVLAMGFTIWGVYEIMISKNIPGNVRRRIWYYVFFIGLIIYIVYTKLSVPMM